MDASHSNLWKIVELRQLHVFWSDKGYWVAFDPRTEEFGHASTPPAAVADLERKSAT